MPIDDLKDILTEFRKPDSTTRLLNATIAFGIWIKILDIKYVIPLGVATSVGRAGRNGQPAQAIMYITPFSLINADQAMKDNLNKSLENKCLTALQSQVTTSCHKKTQALVYSRFITNRNYYFFCFTSINGRDVQKKCCYTSINGRDVKKNVVNNVDMSSLWPPWQNGP